MTFGYSSRLFWDLGCFSWKHVEYFVHSQCLPPQHSVSRWRTTEAFWERSTRKVSTRMVLLFIYCFHYNVIISGTFTRIFYLNRMVLHLYCNCCKNLHELQNCLVIIRRLFIWVIHYYLGPVLRLFILLNMLRPILTYSILLTRDQPSQTVLSERRVLPLA